MATARIGAEVFYPESDGKPMAETPVHMEVMYDLIVGLRDWFAADPLVYVSGNNFLYFVEGDPRRNVSPDVFVVRGIDKSRYRGSYKTWEDGGKAPDLVVEVSSRSTRLEDLRQKFALYRDVLKVREYFLFDPFGEYLKPPLQGYRLVGEEYEPIEPEAGRLPSEVLGLHLEADGDQARLFDPAAGRRLLTRLEAVHAEKAARLRGEAILQAKDAAIQEKDAAIQAKDAAIQAKDAAIQAKDAAIQEQDAAIQGKDVIIKQVEAATLQAEAEADRLRRELEAIKAGPRPKPKKKRD